MTAAIAAIARASRWAARKVAQLWRALPGPTWAKVLLIALCLAIPGPADELILIAAAGVLAARKVRSR